MHSANPLRSQVSTPIRFSDVVKRASEIYEKVVAVRFSDSAIEISEEYDLRL
jgi:hypothetical protein